MCCCGARLLVWGGGGDGLAEFAICEVISAVKCEMEGTVVSDTYCAALCDTVFYVKILEGHCGARHCLRGGNSLS